MSSNSVQYHAAVVVEHLSANGHDGALETIERLLADLAIEERVDRTLNEIIGYCGARAFGDLAISTMTLTEWLKALGRLERSCRRALKERGAVANDGLAFPPRYDGEPVASNGIPTTSVGQYGSDALAIRALRRRAADLGVLELDDDEDDGETAALRHFIAAGAFVLAMMAAVVFILTVYRVPNLWSFYETATVSRTDNGMARHHPEPPGVTIASDRQDSALL